MTLDVRTPDVSGQLDLATGVLLSMFRLVFDDFGAMDREATVGFLSDEAGKHREQGNVGAADMLEEWAEDLSVV